MHAAMSVGPSSTNVSTNRSGVPRTSRKWTKWIRPCDPEAADGGGEVVRHQRDVPLAHRHPVRRARLELEDAVVRVERADDAPDPAKRRERRVVRVEREPHARLLRRPGRPARGTTRGVSHSRSSATGASGASGRVLPGRDVEAGGRRAAARRQRGRRPRPRDDRHPVVTPHLDPEPAHGRGRARARARAPPRDRAHRAGGGPSAGCPRSP